MTHIEPPLEKQVSFTYTNWRGETKKRTVVPISIRFGISDYHEGEQWFLVAFDIEKGDLAIREFAMKDIEGME